MATWRGDSVYTPGFVVNGKEWQRWFGGDVTPTSSAKVGVLRVSLCTDGKFSASFVPETRQPRGLVLNVALLGNDLESNVKRGENSGRKLRHGDILYRYALERVRKPDVAQDLVQETFLAAVRTQERFRGGSTVRSWLCGILKHKICDYYRKLGRETSFTDLEFLSDECAEKFVPEGYWVHMNGPREWKPEADEVMHRD